MKPPSFNGNRARLGSLLAIMVTVLISAYGLATGNFGKLPKSQLYEVLDVLHNRGAQTPELKFTEDMNIEPFLKHRYRVLSRIGGRAEGDALEAWDVQRNRSVVAKCYQEDKTKEFNNELRALAALVTSPPFDFTYGPYLDSFLEIESGRHCIIQPFLGPDLERAMKASGRPYTVQNAVDVLHQILKQLEVSHRGGIIHKDVKRDNVVFVDRNLDSTNATLRVQLIDWGQSSSNVSEVDVLDGRAWQFYRPHPPERVLQLAASYPMDVWGIGIVTMNMLTGKGKFPNVLNTTESLAAYFDTLEMIAGCIPADMLPPGWRHDSDAFLKVESTVRKRVDDCSQETDSANLLTLFTETATPPLEQSPLLEELADLLSQILRIDPGARPTAAAALAHPLFHHY